MSAVHALIAHLIEADEDEEGDFDIKDVASSETFAGRAEVTRHGRWKVVDMPNYAFLISYLTPVAYHDKQLDAYYQTSKQWSPATNKHIRAWQQQIWKSPEHQANAAYWEQSDALPGTHWVRYPTFTPKKQSEISELFRKLMATMEIKPHAKRRLYHVDPRMRSGSPWTSRVSKWASGHLKHHDSGEQGLPRPEHAKGADPELDKFFGDFSPDEAEMWDWQQSEVRSQEPHEPD